MAREQTRASDGDLHDFSTPDLGLEAETESETEGVRETNCRCIRRLASQRARPWKSGSVQIVIINHKTTLNEGGIMSHFFHSWIRPMDIC